MGLILGPAWQTLYDTAGNEPLMVQLQQHIDILTVLQSITGSGLMNRQWYYRPSVLQLKNKQNVKGKWGIYITWAHLKDFQFSLYYDPYHNGVQNAWELWLRRQPRDLTIDPIRTLVMASSLLNLLTACPCLCFGIHPDVILERWDDADDVKALFVRGNKNRF